MTTTRRLVSSVQHKTGSRFRGQAQDIDRCRLAAAMRAVRRITGTWTDGANAVGMLIEYRDVAVCRDYN